MPIYLITGISGSGKSTALEALRQRGLDAYDVDVAGPVTAKWHHNTTGYVHPKSSVKQEDRTPEFLANHSWKVPRQEVVDLAAQAGAKHVFIGGSIGNEDELQDLFAQVFALAISDDTLRHRLVTRTNNNWGKSAHELEQSLAINHELAEKYHRYGYTVIDASQPTNTVVAEVLSYIYDN